MKQKIDDLIEFLNDSKATAKDFSIAKVMLLSICEELLLARAVIEAVSESGLYYSDAPRVFDARDQYNEFLISVPKDFSRNESLAEYCKKEFDSPGDKVWDCWEDMYAAMMKVFNGKKQ